MHVCFELPPLFSPLTCTSFMRSCSSFWSRVPWNHVYLSQSSPHFSANAVAAGRAPLHKLMDDGEAALQREGPQAGARQEAGVAGECFDESLAAAVVPASQGMHRKLRRLGG